MGLISFFFGPPIELVQNYIIQPVLNRTNATYEGYKRRTTESVISTRELIFKLAIVALAAAVIIWLSIFMYIVFYYTYMPAIAHVRPVHMQFEACKNLNGLCTFPQAHVLLTKKQQLLMVGQPYRISINIDMPESEQNLELGMFMVCTEMRDQSTKLRSHSCRSAMLHYRSYLTRTLSTIIMSPLIILGFKEETQQIPVELFSSYEDEQDHPVTDVYVEIQSKQIQFYSVTLHITAHFSGLRYIMFHWPLLSASIGVGANLFFILTVCLLSWYHWSDSVWVEEAKQRLRNRATESRKRRERGIESTMEELSMSTSFEESQKGFDDIEDDEDISIIDEQALSKLDEEAVEELSGISEIKQRKSQRKADVSTGTTESFC